MAEILLVDDDTATLDLVRRALESEGHKVVVKSDGLDAAEALGLKPFDALVTDLQMPGLDGIELATKAVGAHPKVRVLFMSGFSEGFERAEAVACDKRLSITKPFSLEQIKATVAELLR